MAVWVGLFFGGGVGRLGKVGAWVGGGGGPTNPIAPSGIRDGAAHISACMGIAAKIGGAEDTRNGRIGLPNT